MKTLDLLTVIKLEAEQLVCSVLDIKNKHCTDPSRGYARHAIKKLRADLLTLDTKLKEHQE